MIPAAFHSWNNKIWFPKAKEIYVLFILFFLQSNCCLWLLASTYHSFLLKLSTKCPWNFKITEARHSRGIPGAGTCICLFTKSEFTHSYPEGIVPWRVVRLRWARGHLAVSQGGTGDIGGPSPSNPARILLSAELSPLLSSSRLWLNPKRRREPHKCK